MKNVIIKNMNVYIQRIKIEDRQSLNNSSFFFFFMNIPEKSFQSCIQSEKFQSSSHHLLLFTHGEINLNTCGDAAKQKEIWSKPHSAWLSQLCLHKTKQ